MPDVAAKKVIVMLVTIFSFLCSGSIYVFAAVADDIKANQNYTQAEMLILGASVYTCGGFLGYSFALAARKHLLLAYTTASILTPPAFCFPVSSSMAPYQRLSLWSSSSFVFLALDCLEAISSTITSS